jgi:hypothetical protein
MGVDFSTGHSKQLNYMMLEYARPIECLRGISKQEAKKKKKTYRRGSLPLFRGRSRQLSIKLVVVAQ